LYLALELGWEGSALSENLAASGGELEQAFVEAADF
jgi:hypothetical protein